MAVVGPNLVARNNNLYFSTTETLRNQLVQISAIQADFVIDLDGTIYSNRTNVENQAYIVLVGGYDTFVSEKANRTPTFYMTDKQKLTIYNILKAVAVRTDAAQVSSDNSTLDMIVKATYINYCG